MNKLLMYTLCLFIIILPVIPENITVKGLPIYEIILIIIFLIYILNLVLYLENFKSALRLMKYIVHDKIVVFMILLNCFMFISVFYSMDKRLAINESIRFTTYIILYIVIKYNPNSKSYIKTIIKSFVFISIVLSIIGVFQYVTGIRYQQEYFIKYGSKILIRESSTFENPNTFASFLMIAIFPIIMLAAYYKNKIIKLIYVLASILLIINIALTRSRNAEIALILGGIFIAIIYSRKIFVFLCSFGVIGLLIPQVRFRFKSILDNSQNSSRLNLWKIALKMFKDHPIGGVGNGNYASYYNLYVKRYPKLQFDHFTSFPTHESYLKVLSELGVIGITLFIGLLVQIILMMIKLKRCITDQFIKNFYFGFFASLVIFLFMNLFENLFFLPKVTYCFWMLIACLDSINIDSNKIFKYS